MKIQDTECSSSHFYLGRDDYFIQEKITEKIYKTSRTRKINSLRDIYTLF